jgi:hypothetical protein
MASNINPQNIDGAYPVAGQDNDSQGFRDNFTNTKTNFQFAAAEITDLQNKAVLKAALFCGSILSNAQLQDMSETRVALGTVSGAQTINYAAGSYYTVTTSGSVSIAFTNFPPAGQLGRLRLQISVASTAHTLTLPAAVSVGTANIQGYSANIITFNQTGTFEFEFETNDGGSTITIIDQNRNLDPMYLPSSEDLADAGAASLTKTTSFFTTAAAETATLAAGVTGQVKVFAAVDVTAGNMVITVSNAGWKASGTGTITFDARGEACTLMYIDAKWFVIGNNGCAFA